MRENIAMERIIVFGTGVRLGWLLEYGYLCVGKIVAFCDNDIHKQGAYINGIEIIAPEEIRKYEYDAVYITTLKYLEEIKAQLISECKIPKEKIKTFKVYQGKYHAELDFWKRRCQLDNGIFQNSFYKKLMLDIAGENDDEFMRGKIVADFGCGPRGSLAWSDSPLMKIGIDVLANKYLDNFGGNLARHNMIYVTSSEKQIPIPDSFVDCLDHVDNLYQMIRELMRILKLGGLFLANFNLYEPETETEPQSLTEKIIGDTILKYIEVLSYKLVFPDGKEICMNPKADSFRYFIDEDIRHNGPCKLLLKGKKIL